ncbi:2639_t:CDS:2 [Entrophospora sp. SA101]|nr:2639_t:CDS:2 [Entrophospora sp. SA101]
MSAKNISFLAGITKEKLNTPNLYKYVKDKLLKYEPTTWKTKLNAFSVYAKFQKLKIHWQRVAKLIPKIQRKFHITINEQELVKLKQARFEESDSIYQRNSLILDFLFYSGLRVSELVNIKHRD